MRKKSSFWWLWGWWLMNLFKDCSVESCTSNIDQSVLIRAFSQSLLFPERRHYIPEKSNVRSDHSKALWEYYTWDPWRQNFDGLIFILWRGWKRSTKSTKWAAKQWKQQLKTQKESDKLIPANSSTFLTVCLAHSTMEALYSKLRDVSVQNQTFVEYKEYNKFIRCMVPRH